MHDIDRTIREFEHAETLEYQGEEEYGHELGHEQEFSHEYAGELGYEYGNEMEQEYTGEYERGVFDEVQEMEFAAELLEITNEQEMEQFLGKLFKKAAGAVRTFARSPMGKQLGGMLKGVAAKALPKVGAALGNFVVPGIGGVIGAKLGGLAGAALSKEVYEYNELNAEAIFGLELEGLSNEDREFEVARRVVRLAGQAAHNATQASPGASASAVARGALVTAARRHAPGIVSALSGGRPPRRGGRPGACPTCQSSGGGSRRPSIAQGAGIAGVPGVSGPGLAGLPVGRSGRWIRRGNTIVIICR